ncbi:MAG: fibronectin type III domain-containing protein [Candidatus Diapherotrites archaeon]
MKRGIFKWTGIIGIIFLAAFVMADPIVVITDSSYTVLDGAPVSIHFTLLDENFLGVNPTVSFYLSNDNDTLEIGTDILVEGSLTFVDAGCDGNVSETATCTHALTFDANATDGYVFVDTTLPASSNGVPVTFTTTPADVTAPTMSATFDGTPYTSSFFTTNKKPVVVFTATDGSGGSGVDDATFTFSFDGTPDTNVTMTSGTATWTSDVNLSGTHVLSVHISDVAGNGVDTNYPFTIDVDAPTGVSASATTSYTNDTTPTITINATDGSGVKQMKAFLKCSGASTGVERTLNDAATEISDFDITTGPNCSTTTETKTIVITVKDGLGNTASDVSVDIKYDGTPPTVPSGFNNGSINTNSIELTWSASTDGASGVKEYLVFRHTSDNASASSQATTTSSTSTTVSGLDACTAYFFWVKSRDNAGNMSDFSTKVSATTSGCSNSGSSNSGSGSGSGGGGGGGGGGGSCTLNPVFDVPPLYGGESATVKVTTTSSQVWQLRANIPGKQGTQDLKTGTGTTAEAEIAVPNQVGKVIDLFYKYSAGGCSVKKTYTIKDPSTKPTENEQSENNSQPVQNNVDSQEDEMDSIEPALHAISLNEDAVAGLLSLAGFNAENEGMRTSIVDYMNKWGITKTIRVVPIEGVDDEYVLQLVIKWKNTTNHGNVKLIENVPKELAELAEQLESNYAMTVLKDDPLIQFEISDLYEGQEIEIVLTGKTIYNITTANTKAASIAETGGTPPLLFADGAATLNPENQSDFLAGFSGLASGVGGSLPLILGFIVVIGLIFVSIRTVKSSLGESNNPIIRASNTRISTRPREPSTAVRGNHIWKSDE